MNFGLRNCTYLPILQDNISSQALTTFELELSDIGQWRGVHYCGQQTMKVWREPYFSLFKEYEILCEGSVVLIFQILYMCDPDMVITVSADTPAPNDARPSTGTVLTTKLDMIFHFFSVISDTEYTSAEQVSS